MSVAVLVHRCVFVEADRFEPLGCVPEFVGSRGEGVSGMEDLGGRRGERGGGGFEIGGEGGGGFEIGGDGGER